MNILSRAILFPTLAFASSAFAQGGLDDYNWTEIGILPTYKQSDLVEVSERNPYAERLLEEVEEFEDESEAMEIRKRLEQMRISSVSRLTSGLVVTLNDIILRKGRELPPLIPNQTDRLVVSDISEEEIVLTWLTEAGNSSSDARRLTIPLDLRTTYESVLPGRLTDEEKEFHTQVWRRRDEIQGRERIADIASRQSVGRPSLPVAPAPQATGNAIRASVIQPGEATSAMKESLIPKDEAPEAAAMTGPPAASDSIWDF